MTNDKVSSDIDRSFSISGTRSLADDSDLAMSFVKISSQHRCGQWAGTFPASGHCPHTNCF